PKPDSALQGNKRMQATEKQIADYKLLVSALLEVYDDTGNVSDKLGRMGFERMFPDESVWEYYVNYEIRRVETAPHYGLKESVLRYMDQVYRQLNGLKRLEKGNSLLKEITQGEKV